eukprot:TRINITY_DN26733_c0_g1_i1.p1 TRINITY_DN26733_c0_g1~~TRINITY_DN26733_c0_g1_i1.p1  ORF type:complete len:607 (-),score=142.89 TRINITY_DN26733_c0_g1_i1:161-1981(-)
MLPSFQLLARERSLLLEVLRAAPRSAARDGVVGTCASAADLAAKLDDGKRVAGAGARRRCLSAPADTDLGGSVPRPPAEGECSKSVGDVAQHLASLDGLQKMPKELLVDIARQFLSAPVWHSCQLGEASPDLGKVFLDDSLWEQFLEGRLSRGCPPRGASKRSSSGRLLGLRRQSSERARESYAQLHQLEARFRGGQYAARGTLDHPRAGAAVLDLRVAAAEGFNASVAFAASRDGSVVAYDLGHPLFGGFSLHEENGPPRAASLCDLSPRFAGGPALCVLPVLSGEASETTAAAPVLVAGYSMGRLAAWTLPDGRHATPEHWETAHHGRVTSLAALSGGGAVLSASSDGLLKAWSLDNERFGHPLETFSGHGSAVISVAANPFDDNIFLTGGQDRSVRLWDRRQSSSAGAVARWLQQDWATCVEWHPFEAGAFLSSDKRIYQWDMRTTGGSPLRSAHSHRKLISRFRADAHRLASCSLDGCVKVSSLEEAEVRVASPKGSPASSPSFAPSEAPTVLPGSDSFSLDGGEVCTMRTSSDYVLCIDFDDTRLLAGSVDGRVDVYDFSDAGNFRRGSPSSSPMSSPYSRHCGEPIDVQMTGMPEPLESF